MVNKERNKVMYVEAGKDFVDVLFSFLTLPLGTIARLVAEESNIEAVRFGSISSIYQSVTNLDEQCLWTNTCKEMLLKPRNSMVAYCRKMKLNIDNTEPMKHFVCGKWECVRKESGSLLSLFKNQKCSCGKVLNRELSLPPECLSFESGFVKETASFVISDDLYVMPNVFGTFVVDILKLSLVSKTPLTDFIFKKKYSELVIGQKVPM
ncbi:tyrosine/dopa decarboxylase, partial [Trifolium medium]|nr:tyrosine/dopa decarboxylase [Trifolium medium]